MKLTTNETVEIITLALIVGLLMMITLIMMTTNAAAAAAAARQCRKFDTERQRYTYNTATVLYTVSQKSTLLSFCHNFIKY